MPPRRDPAAEAAGGMSLIEGGMAVLQAFFNTGDRSEMLQIVETLGKIGREVPEKSVEAMTSLKKIVLENRDSIVKSAAAREIGGIGKAVPELGGTSIAFLQRVCIESDLDSNTSMSVAKSIGEIGKAVPQLAATALVVMMQMVFRYQNLGPVIISMQEIAKLFPKAVVEAIVRLQSSVRDKNEEDEDDFMLWLHTAVGMREIFQLAPEKAAEVVDFLQKELMDEDCGIVGRRVAAQALGEVVKVVPEKATEVMAILQKALNGTKPNVKMIVVSAIEEIGKSVPQKIVEAMAILQIALEDQEWNIRSKSAHSIGNIGKAVPGMALKAITILQVVLKDQSWEVRSSAIHLIGEIVKADPTLATDVITIVQKGLVDENGISAAAVDAILEIVESIPEKASEALVVLREVLRDTNWPVSEIMQKGLLIIIQNIYTDNIDYCDWTLEFLRNENFWVKRAVVDAINNFVSNINLYNSVQQKIVTILNEIMEHEAELESYAKGYPGQADLVKNLLTKIPKIIEIGDLKISGDALFHDKHYGEAIEKYKAAVMLLNEPGNSISNGIRASISYNMARAFHSMGDIEQAAEVYQITLVLDLHHAKSLECLGRCYAKLNKKAKAIDAFKKALEEYTTTHQDDRVEKVQEMLSGLEVAGDCHGISDASQ